MLLLFLAMRRYSNSIFWSPIMYPITAAQERAVYRKMVKTLSDARSVYVHTGQLNAGLADRDLAVRMTREVLRTELLGFGSGRT